MKRFASIIILNILFVVGLFSQEEFGLASYYSDLFHGKPTASGELYDKGKLTAAHKTLPFGTMVKVTRLDNNKSVTVRVTDRGPFISGRVIELSRAAASQVDLINDGSARVKVEIVSEKAKEEPAVVTTPPATPPATTPKTYTQEPEAVTAKPEKPVTKAPAETTPATTAKATDAKKETARVNTKPEKAKAKGKAEPVVLSEPVLVKGSDYQPYDLYQIELKRPEKKGFGVQVAALTTQDALFKKMADLQGEWFSTILVSVQKGSKGDMLYKVILGTFATEAEANTYKANLKKNKKMDGFVVDLSTLSNE